VQISECPSLLFHYVHLDAKQEIGKESLLVSSAMTFSPAMHGRMHGREKKVDQIFIQLQKTQLYTRLVGLGV
jgi:hypothetical protein